MNNTNESGRSMVEMLGVLAIIGVLSIGGIAGYTQAMRRYRANEMLNAISMLAVTAKTRTAGGAVHYVEAFPGAASITGMTIDPNVNEFCTNTSNFCAVTNENTGVVTVYAKISTQDDCKALKSMIDGTSLMNTTTGCSGADTVLTITVS